MIDWLYNLPIFWMAVVVFGATYIVAAIVDRIVLILAVRDGCGGLDPPDRRT